LADKVRPRLLAAGGMAAYQTSTDTRG
jgi:hypothetical protein